MHLAPSSFRGSAQVSPYLYMPPKQRWWPILAALLALGVCLLAILGPSQPAGLSGRAVYQVRSSYAILAKHLAPAPGNLALNRDSQVHARPATEFGAAPAFLELNVTGPESATTSIDLHPRISSVARIEASPVRPTATKRDVRRSILRSSYASARQHLRHVAMKSRGHEKPSKAYARHYHNQEMSPYGRYPIASQGFGY